MCVCVCVKELVREGKISGWIRASVLRVLSIFPSEVHQTVENPHRPISRSLSPSEREDIWVLSGSLKCETSEARSFMLKYNRRGIQETKQKLHVLFLEGRSCDEYHVWIRVSPVIYEDLEAATSP